MLYTHSLYTCTSWSTTQRCCCCYSILPINAIRHQMKFKLNLLCIVDRHWKSTKQFGRLSYIVVDVNIWMEYTHVSCALQYFKTLAPYIHKFVSKYLYTYIYWTHSSGMISKQQWVSNLVVQNSACDLIGPSKQNHKPS